jgi:hypothetical protein
LELNRGRSYASAASAAQWIDAGVVELHGAIYFYTQTFQAKGGG